MCAQVLVNTQRREAGSEKIFPGWCSPPGWGAETCHTSPLCPLYFVLSVTILLSYAKLHSVTLCFLIRIVTESTKHTITSGNPGLAVCLGHFGSPACVPPRVLCAFWPHFAPRPVSPLRVRVVLANFGAFKFDWGECPPRIKEGCIYDVILSQFKGRGGAPGPEFDGPGERPRVKPRRNSYKTPGWRREELFSTVRESDQGV